jgi:hypothetical protein
VPFDIVGEHAQEDVGANAVGETMVDGPDAHVDGFEGEECALDLGQGLVGAHAVWGGEALRGQGCADDVDAVERGFGGDLVGDLGEAEGVVLDVELEVLGDLVLIDDPADSEGDLGASGEAAGFDPGLYLGQGGLGGVHQVLALVRA